eukprot:TRINITY_DN2149_c0_g2_i1.p1 TRINITY_DN2149_c0_g2~~TRINITY_DN2149_c0_g2_i1.p1  ORF type:complete len:458 (+),score=155.72 TRINITY_DN2149_c0_g2_i1:90-1376(+)
MRAAAGLAAVLPLAAAFSAPGPNCGGDWYRDPTNASAADTMTMYKLPNAKCIDGSPAVYYIARNPKSTKYVVWLEGGGACFTLEDCKLRAKSVLGSSKMYMPFTQAARGMLKGNAEENPDFADWNRIFVPYCSGDVYSGTKPEALNPWKDPSVPGHGKVDDPFRGYFMGHTHVAEVVTDIKSKHGADKATEAILTGCSAGGIGTFNNCDYFAAQFPATRAVCRPEGGWFGLPIANYEDWKAGRDSPDMHNANDTWWLWEIDAYTLNDPAVDACMRATHNGSDLPYCNQLHSPFPGKTQGRACCNSVPYMYPHIKTPMFISQNLMDSYQVATQGHAPLTATGYIKYLHDVIASSITEEVLNGPKKATDGLFATACLQHCPIPWSGAGAPMIGELNNMLAFGDWYFNRTTTGMWLDNQTDPAHYYKCATP